MGLIGNITRQDLYRVFSLKHGNPNQYGPYLQKCLKTNYFTPDDWYETLIDQCVCPDTLWLDVGCGRFVFPNNQPLAQRLSERCRHLVGLDPDPTIQENIVVHEKVNCLLSEYRTTHTFDLITMRMVAEHIQDPSGLLAGFAHLLNPSGKVVIFTPFLWSPIPILTRLIPFQLHHSIKKKFWGTEEKDTFPVAYKMNTRRTLNRLFQQVGLKELDFAYLNDCRTLLRFPLGYRVELMLEHLLRLGGWHYPEVCLLGVYGFNDMAAPN